MEAFLMSLDMRSWRAIISGWEYPTEKDEVVQIVQKSVLKWTKDEDDAAVGNSRALNALFNAVHPNIFKLINTCKSAKAAWDILEVAFEGTYKVKISRLQILTSRFEALQRTEDETIVEFNVHVLRSLSSKFNMKVTAIEEANDLSKMKLDELFGSLRTFEIHLGHTAIRRKLGHMTGNADFFSELSECKARSVVFGDEGKGYQVSFSKDRCNVMDSQTKVFLSGTRLSNNCYHWDVEVNLCNLSKVEEASLWHK
ncbi:gag-pol polyprotein [Cucumis melo var. makuwa]|uniref:Gag-pol polyprotein n=1 Tax=Cucumis melo var. makuwa TaxID=1194695 RepID=A0A5D3D0F8_CUCMM|nr:gag-pol polyprotein [Cucumis melo var. makuwa]TYK15939.1 gag-pol polyprotein [Cucumis melo var. makuwa]